LFASLVLFPRVDAELKPWIETGITRQMLDNLWRCDNGKEEKYRVLQEKYRVQSPVLD
jgi:hypothetical protein